MILGVDIGGTKTLFGIFNEDGELLSTNKIPTPKRYSDFINSFKDIYNSLNHKISLISIAAPGRIDKKNAVVVSYGNLNWRNTPLEKDITDITNKPVFVENDAKLAALSEARQLTPKADKVLYITFSTGIGAGLVYKDNLDEAMLDSEAGQILLPNPEYNNQLTSWEKFASGKALYEKYNKKAEDLNDKKSWEEFTKKMSLGIVDLCAVTEPDVVIIGGSVGTYFDKYSESLKKHIYEMLPKIVKKPTIYGAKNAELASLLGCYEKSKKGIKK